MVGDAGDLLHLDPPFNPNSSYEVLWGETKDRRPFEGVMTTQERTKGFFVAFDYSDEALRELDLFFRTTGKVIVPLTVREILDETLARKLA